MQLFSLKLYRTKSETEHQFGIELRATRGRGSPVYQIPVRTGEKPIHSTIHQSIVHVILWGRPSIHRQISHKQPQNPGIYAHQRRTPRPQFRSKLSHPTHSIWTVRRIASSGLTLLLSLPDLLVFDFVQISVESAIGM